jgi:di/tricarboxylate transporter
MTEPDWLKWLVDRAGDLGKGLFCAWLVTTLAYYFGGEFPSKTSTATAIAAIYIVAVLLFDDPNFSRHVEGFLFFVVYGAIGTIISFREYEVGESIAVFDLHGPLPIVALTVAHALAGVFLRLRG